MQTVFVSHSSEDTEFARRLAADLKSHNWDARTFEDVVSPEIPLSSTEIDDRIVRAIQTDSFYIPILTPAALTSNWFRREIEIAINSEELGSVVSILPALREDCLIPDILDLRTPCDFTTSYDTGFESLLEKLSVPVIRSDATSLRETKSLPFIISALRKELQSKYFDLYNLSSMKFEELIGEIFESNGYQVELSKRTSDGGIDLFVVGAKHRNSLALIECKRYAQGRRIGIEPVRSLYDVSDSGANRRSLISTTFSNAAVNDYQRKSFWHCARSRWDLSYADYSAVLIWLASYPDLSSEITQPIDQAREKHTELVDKKFSKGLSSNEQNELVLLEELIEEAEAPLYSPTIRRLREIRDKLSSDPSRQ